MVNELRSTEVVILDFQTTGSTPRTGHLLEVAWSFLRTDSEEKAATAVFNFLVSLPHGEMIPPRISGMTGITDDMLQNSLHPREVFELIRSALRRGPPVAHYAMFEQKWLDHLYSRFAGGDEAPRLFCTRELARRLYPGLPRKGIRAVSGFLNYSMGEKKRASDHVSATAEIWNRMVEDLSDRGITTFSRLDEILKAPSPVHRSSWEYALSRERRLSVPDVPGVYRFLSRHGRTLYVGKATSLRRRVNSYFTKRRADEKTLELVSQVHDVTIIETATPLEAALLEFETIRAKDPPYNVALRSRNHGKIFLSRDLCDRSDTPGADFPFGPVSRTSVSLLLGGFLKMLNGTALPDPDFLGLDYLPLEDGALEIGLSDFVGEHITDGPVVPDTLLRLGIIIGRKSRESEKPERNTDEAQLQEICEPVKIIGPERVRIHLEGILASGVRDILTGAWLCLLGWSVIHWKPKEKDGSRFLKIESGSAVSSGWHADYEKIVPSDPGNRLQRQMILTGWKFDMLKVLNSELRRIAGAGMLQRVSLSRGVSITGERIQSMFRTV